MTKADYAELKRVCRIRGVPEPTEATAEAFHEAQRLEVRKRLREMAEMLRREAPRVWAPGPGFAVPDALLWGE